MTAEGAPSIVAVRASRHGRLILARIVGRAPTAHLGEVVLVDQGGTELLAQVVVTAAQVLAAPYDVPLAQVVAVGAGHPEVARALEARNYLALADAQRIVGDEVTVHAARWSADLGRLSLLITVDPANDRSETRERLERFFQASVHLLTLAAAT